MPIKTMLGFIRPNQTNILVVLALLCLLVFIVASINGSFDVPVYALIEGTLTELQKTVFIEIRIPRVVLSMIVGASLGLCGAALQGLFRNPLADPGLIGVSAGAALGAALMIVIGSAFLPEFAFGEFLLPAAGMTGAALVIMLLYLSTRGFGYQGVSYMLLVGIAINAITGVCIGILTYISSDAELRTLTFWTMGSFGGANWRLLIPAAAIIIVAMIFMVPTYRKLDLVQLGEIEAYRLGVDVKQLKYRIIVCSAAAVGASVAVSGIIGFVGLIVPHLMRLIGGVNHNYLLPASALFGASLMVSADLLARILIQPAELPIGLITSAIGSPFFLWLIFRMNKNEY
jgi:iron complex transport system permease protein